MKTFAFLTNLRYSILPTAIYMPKKAQKPNPNARPGNRRFSLNVKKELGDVIEALAVESNHTYSSFIRSALDEYMNRHDREHSLELVKKYKALRHLLRDEW
jgi:hypothetical protein